MINYLLKGSGNHSEIEKYHTDKLLCSGYKYFTSL